MMDLLKMARFKKKASPLPHQNHTPHSISNSHSHSNEEESTAIASPVQPQTHNFNEEEEEEEDLITKEVKRRLKELRKNTFMVLIPEEDDNEQEDQDADDDQEDQHQQDARDTTAAAATAFDFGLEGLNAWLCGFDSLYDKYCQRMLFFDRIITTITNTAHLLPSTSTSTSTNNHHPESLNAARKSPRSPANKLASTIRNLSFKRRDPDHNHYHNHNHSDDLDLLPSQSNLHQQHHPLPFQALETAYVAHLSLSWEALHCQYAQLQLKISSQTDTCISYSRAAEAFQQFQVLLQRFIETEPFEPGSRVDIYTRSRAHLSKLLQVPNFQGLDRGDQPRDESEPSIAATDLIRVLEESILTFRLFLKKDKTKSGSLSGAHSAAGTSIHQVQASLDKKEMRVKELFKKKKGWNSKTWPRSAEEVELVFALTDIKVVARVLRMGQLSKEQLLWCEEKMSKIDLSSDGKMRRDASPIIFPC